MNAFLTGIGKTLSIWPDTDYLSLFSKKGPTQEAWENVGKSIVNSLRKQDDLLREMAMKGDYCFSPEQEQHLSKARSLLSGVDSQSQEISEISAAKKMQLIAIEIQRLNSEIEELRKLSSKETISKTE